MAVGAGGAEGSKVSKRSRKLDDGQRTLVAGLAAVASTTAVSSTAVATLLVATLLAAAVA